ALSYLQLFAVIIAGAIKPGFVIEVLHVHYQRVAIPITAGIALPEADRTDDMFGVVGVNRAHGSELTNERDVTWTLQNLERCWEIHRARHTERITVQAREVCSLAFLEVLLALLECFRQIWNLAAHHHPRAWRRIATSTV